MLPGAIFDQDGLLFDTEVLYARSWVAAGKEMGFAVPREFCTAVSGSSGPGMERIVHTYFPNIDAKAYIRRLFQICHEEQARCLPEKPGVREILGFFKERGVRMAVASSSRREQIRLNLARAGLTDYFDAVVSGEDVVCGKPDPAIFRAAAEQLGLAPEECYVFEDSFNGVRAGHAAGCRTIMIPDLRQPDEEIAQLYDGCCETLLEAMEKIAAGVL